MDKKVEDKMVQQIEKNLHNHIDENMYLTGHSADKDKLPKKNSSVGSWKAVPEVKETGPDNPLVSLDYYNPVLPVSRSEYIRQARESCLRQLSTMQSSASAYDSYYLDNAIQNAKQETNKKARPYNSLFHDGNEAATAEDNRKEIAAFRFLVVRMVCAIVLFLSIFLIDKFDIKVGSFNSDKVQEYVTGKDNLKQLEEFVITLLKE
ncbi:MAG: putative rane protein [Firmicutes bacterium]|nr:putative rane protein [Bacillota bacterium]